MAFWKRRILECAGNNTEFLIEIAFQSSVIYSSLHLLAFWLKSKSQNNNYCTGKAPILLVHLPLSSFMYLSIASKSSKMLTLECRKSPRKPYLSSITLVTFPEGKILLMKLKSPTKMLPSAPQASARGARSLLPSACPLQLGQEMLRRRPFPKTQCWYNS